MKGLKNYNSYLLLFLLCFAFSCSLEEEILDESTGAELLEQEDIELNIVAPAYGSLNNVLGCCLIFPLNEISSDEAVIPAKGLDWFDGGTWIQLHEQSWNPEHGVLNGSWNSLESGVARANAGLVLLTDQPSNLSTDELKSLQAELRFLRAYYRYHILDLFRQVPMRDEQDQNFNNPPPVFSATEAFDWLETELKTIRNDLKEHGVVPYGRISKEAANSLLAKLYLNAEVYTGTPRWDECLEACNAVINSGHFNLADDYFQLFSYDNDIDNPEAIFVIRQSFESQNNVFFTPSFTLHYNHNFGQQKFSFNGWTTVEDFFLSWDEDGDLTNGVNTSDLRFQDERIRAATGANLGMLEGPQFHPDGSPIEDSQLSGQTGNFVQLDYTPQINSLTQALQHQGVRIIKYNPDPNSNAFFVGRNDYLLLRYADIWLMKAEALFRSGQPGALEQFNTLRTIRGAAPLDNLTAEAILAERGFELYWEGHRRQDLIRFGQFTAGTWAFKQPTADYRNVFPIPQAILNINENLTQNPGY